MGAGEFDAGRAASDHDERQKANQSPISSGRFQQARTPRAGYCAGERRHRAFSRRARGRFFVVPEP